MEEQVAAALSARGRATALLVTGDACSEACAGAIRRLGARAVSVDLLDLPLSASSWGNQSLAKFDWCGASGTSIVLVEDVDAALSVLGQQGQAGLLQLVSKTLRSGQHILLTSSSTHAPLSGCGKVLRSVLQLVDEHLRLGEAVGGSGVPRRRGGRGFSASGRAAEAALLIAAFAGSIESTDADALALVAEELRKI